LVHHKSPKEYFFGFTPVEISKKRNYLWSIVWVAMDYLGA